MAVAVTVLEPQSRAKKEPEVHQGPWKRAEESDEQVDENVA
jgi:hypothetical protein